MARQQLNEIRAQALKSVELSTQLMQANEKILELQNKLMAPVTMYPALPVTSSATVAAVQIIPETPSAQAQAIKAGLVSAPAENQPQPKADPRSGPFPKVECPHCKKLVSTSPGAWGSHQASAHPDNRAPNPNA